MGLDEVPAITSTGLTEAQKRALRLADNKIALNAGWDLEILKLELAELATLDIDIDLALTGFSTGEIDVVLEGRARSRRRGDPGGSRRARAPARRHLDPGRAPHRLRRRARSAFLQAVVGEGAQVDAAFLDPPYNVRINGHANAKGRHREFAMASGEMSDAAFRAFLADTLGACATVSRDGAVHFVCMDWRHMDDVTAVGADVYGELLNLCVWNKSNAGMGSLYRSKHELVFVYRVGEAPHFNAVELGKHGRNRTNVWDYASVNSMRRQPARGPGAASDGQAGRDGRRRDPGRDAAGRTRARHLPRLGHDADRRRAHRAAVPRARHRSGLCRCGDRALVCHDGADTAPR